MNKTRTGGKWRCIATWGESNATDIENRGQISHSPRKNRVAIGEMSAASNISLNDAVDGYRIGRAHNWK